MSWVDAACKRRNVTRADFAAAATVAAAKRLLNHDLGALA